MNWEDIRLLPKVEILLSTYNGEKYLKEQLDSLLAQADVDIHITARDDGSTDKTVEILEMYKNKAKIRVIIGENIGFAKSFWELLILADSSDFYAFCDQDDIWHSDKMISAVDMINSQYREKVLYTSNAIAVDQDLQVIKEQAFPDAGILSFPDSLKRSILPGCTFVFDDALAQIAKKYDGPLIAHDWLLYMTATAFGKVIYDPVPHISYRIHANNTIGLETKYKKILSKIKRFFFPVLPRRSEIAEAFLTCYECEVSDKIKSLLIDFAYCKKIKCSIRLLKHQEFHSANFILMLLLRKV